MWVIYSPLSIFKGIKKVLIGETIRFDLQKTNKIYYQLLDKSKILNDEEFGKT